MAGLCHRHGGTPSPAHGTGGSLPVRFFLPDGGHGARTHRSAIQGAGSSKGEDLSLITQAEGFPSYLQSGQLGSPNACVLIPQLPATYRGWSDMDGVLMQLISAAVREYDLDSANVSLTGHSMGGTGVWAIAAAHPGTFARIAPLSGSIRKTDENLEALKWVPVYAFVGDADTIVPPESSEAFISALQDQGSNARIEILEGADHFAVPGLAYLGGYGLVDWLIGN